MPGLGGAILPVQRKRHRPYPRRQRPYAKDPARYQQAMEGLSDGVRRDFAASSAYYNAHHTSFGEFSTKVNDTYLKVNSQPQGVATYGRMVDLLLADYRLRHGIG